MLAEFPGLMEPPSLDPVGRRVAMEDVCVSACHQEASTGSLLVVGVGTKGKASEDGE